MVVQTCLPRTTEGRVKVARDEAALANADPAVVNRSSAELLTAGEEATVAGSGGIVKARVSDISQAIAWRERRLVFKSETLENVVAEINRCSTRQFRIESERARHIQLTATLDADQPESLATFLQHYSGLRVEDRGTEFVIQER